SGKPPACPSSIALPKSCQSRNISYEYIGNSKRIITRYGILGSLRCVWRGEVCIGVWSLGFGVLVKNSKLQI
ncbi:MAG: hypothetical protein LBM04_13545, partial [Opitutaceae bacterium]|nr:hypothetical protein [Opitutaceae bacterium]